MRRLSLVIPVYGPDELLQRILAHVPDLREVAHGAGFELVETVVVDDGNATPLSVPGDAGGISILRNERNRGKGYSVRRGALAAKGEWVLMSDVDESTPLTEFAALAAFAECGIVCGSRRRGKDGRPIHRRLLSRIFNLLTFTGLSDTQCGFKLFNMPLMRQAFESLRTERFAFDVELIRRAPSVAEVPVVWRGGRRSSLKVWRDAPRMLWDLALIGATVPRRFRMVTARRSPRP